MALVQLIYSSQPFGYDDLSLQGILNCAVRNNQRDDITGALICREDLFIQLLEGRGELITAAFERIQRDNRHVNVMRQSFLQVGERMFPQWAMRHDPVQSWMWSRAEVSDGRVEGAYPADFREIFLKLAQSHPTEPQFGLVTGTSHSPRSGV